MSNTTLASLEKFKGDFEKMTAAAPEMVKGFGGLFLHIMKDGALKRKEKELVVLGIAVAQCCESCIAVHVQRCLDAGNTAREILEAATVAVVMQIPAVIEALDTLAPKT
jgi:AhpD family alkylhydroperoxidase